MNKFINLNERDRYIKTDLLRDSYLTYEDSLNPTGPRYVSLDYRDLEIGIVSSQVPEISNAVSSILTRSLEDVKNSKGGYLPSHVVERVQTEIISPHGVSELWGTTGHRFVMSRPDKDGMHEIIASILVGRSKDTIFFFTGRYNNLKHSTIEQDVDLNQPLFNYPGHKWFDQFAFPDLKVFKPKWYHQIANFVVVQDYRGLGLARFFLENIVEYYSREHILLHNNRIEHSQHLLCGKGLWQIGDPPWLVKMKALGFFLRGGAESFFIEHDWAPLPPIYQDGKVISNIEYNHSFGLPEMYKNYHPPSFSPLSMYSPDAYLRDRIPEVIRLSNDPKAKLQYFQAMFNFV